MDMIAYFLGKAMSGESGGSSVQSDYLQNDPSAKDYIKNRPFYTEIINEIDTNIIPLQEVEGEASDIEGYLNIALEELDSDSMKKLASIADKGQYNLTIDGTTEQITTIFYPDMEGFLFGNLSIMGMGDDTGETYMGGITVKYDEKDKFLASLTLFLQTTETTHTIGLSHIGDVVPIIVKDTYSFENTENGTVHYFANMWEASFEGDNVYNLTFDDESYEGLSWTYHEISGMNYLGNLSIAGLGDDTGEKYLLVRAPLDDGSVILTMVTSCEAGDYTVSLEKSLIKKIEIIHKIDNKYLDIDIEVPYTEDAEGNVIFEKDIYINHSTSMGEIKDSVSEMTDSVSKITGSVSKITGSVSEMQISMENMQFSMGNMQKKVDSTPNFNTNGTVLENGNIYPSNGISTNSNPPNGYNAWIEGSAAGSVYTIPIFSSSSVLIVSTTTSDKTTTTKAYLDLSIRTTSIDGIVSQLQEYDYIGVKFADNIEKEYYVILSSFNVVDVSNIQIYFSFPKNGDTFSLTNSDNGRIIHSCSAYKNLGENSHAEGNGTKAFGNNSHAEGDHTEASGDNSHAEGFYTKASDRNSHAEGDHTKASGYNSHAEGYGTEASGSESHAEGERTEASGGNSHAEGESTKASGNDSHAEGYFTEATGGCAHAEGRHTKATGDYSHVQGKYNIEDTENKYAHIIGNGDSDSRSNAHTVDWDGNAWFAGAIEAVDGLILNSSTSGSSKKFIVTVDDSGNLTVEETTTE